MKDLTTFIDGLEALTPTGITMLAAPPTAAPDDNALPVGWVMYPTVIGEPPITITNSFSRQHRFRMVLVVAVAYDRQSTKRDYYDTLMTATEAVIEALNAAEFGFRLSYEIGLDTKIKAGSLTFFGLSAVVTGE